MRAILLVTAVALSVPLHAAAGVVAYSGPASEKLFIEEAPKLGKKAYLVKFEGIDSKWAGKVIKVDRTTAPSGDRYTFEYDLELSSGIQKRTWGLLVDAGFELVNGTRVKKLQLFLNDEHAKEVFLNQDPELSKASQKLDLAGEYARSQFKPDVD